MASPYSREFSACQLRPLVLPSFPDDTESRTASALAPPWPLSAADFMDVQLRELARLNDRLNRLNQQFNPLIEACLAGIVPIDVLTTVGLVCWRGEAHELTGYAEPVPTNHYPCWMPVKRRPTEEK